MKGISISAAQSLCNKSGNLPWKASEVQGAELFNLDTFVDVRYRKGVVCEGAVCSMVMVLCVFPCIINGLGY